MRFLDLLQPLDKKYFWKHPHFSDGLAVLPFLSLLPLPLSCFGKSAAIHLSIRLTYCPSCLLDHRWLL
jgi:hypothetical protein